MTLAIASNFDSRLLHIAAQLPPLQQCSAVVVSSIVGYRKPHLRFFQAIQRELRIAAGNMVFVGDDQENDVVGARAAGIQSLLLDRKGPGESNTISSLLEVSDYINKS